MAGLAKKQTGDQEEHGGSSMPWQRTSTRQYPGYSSPTYHYIETLLRPVSCPPWLRSLLVCFLPLILPQYDNMTEASSRAPTRKAPTRISLAKPGQIGYGKRSDPVSSSAATIMTFVTIFTSHCILLLLAAASSLRLGLFQSSLFRLCR